MTNLTAVQVAEAELTGWVNLLGALQTRVVTADFATGLALVNAIGAEAEQLDHHPDLDLRYGHVGIRLSSHDVGGLSGRDIRLARRITTLVTAAGLELEPAGLTRFELGLDTPDAGGLQPFWAAVLALELPEQPDELPDPSTALPTLWFQASGSEEPRQRWHPDLWVDPAEVQPRIDAALAAGGSLVSAESAPSFWVLADPEGNKVCLCTWQERD
ncbi:4a-hydroxytetrahydrobiopterin dehydratase [uncultured Friedmanniella sp.]|uniref:4a-hydroxytetrahydrobiopterin dehydratase n=1 Tax=uncultured Friedmanniella sp. TaxID=335381 RepID=UPI0035CB56D9